jgi:hypothetical protein
LGFCGVFYRVFELTLGGMGSTKRPKNAIKKIEHNNRGRKEKKTEETKTTFFVVGLDGFV